MSIDWTEYAETLDVFLDKTGTLTEKNNTTGDVAHASIPAARGQVTNRMLQATNGALVRPEAAYQVKKSDLTYMPKPGDVWTEGGATYRVQIVHWDDAFWFFGVFDPQLAFGLYDLCTILAITEGRTDARTRTISTAAVGAWTNLACRIQPTSSLWAVQNGKVGDLRTFDIFLDADLAISPATHLVQWADADVAGSPTVVGDIRDVTMRQRLDEPMRLTVELRVGP